jgi:nitroreductase
MTHLNHLEQWLRSKLSEKLANTLRFWDDSSMSTPNTTTLPLSADDVLATTRAVRKRLDFDRPVEKSLIEECLHLATQAPSGSNMQGWHFVVVSDTDKKMAIAEVYRKAFSIYRDLPFAAGNIVTGQSERDEQQQRVMGSAEYLAANFHRAPHLVIPCIEGRIDGQPNMMASSSLGSILPATWSFMLAARARGLGTSWTTLHLMFEQEVAEIVGIPYDEITQTCLTPVAHTIGTDFKPATRVPLENITHWDAW